MIEKNKISLDEIDLQDILNIQIKDTSLFIQTKEETYNFKYELELELLQKLSYFLHRYAFEKNRLLDKGANSLLFNQDYVNDKKKKAYQKFLNRALLIIIGGMAGILFSAVFAPQVLKYIIGLMITNYLLSSVTHYRDILAITPTTEETAIYNQFQIIENGENQFIQTCNQYLQNETQLPIELKQYYTDFAKDLDKSWQKKLGSYPKKSSF